MVLFAGVVFRATVFFSPPSLSDDIHRYLWDGRVQNAGIHPFRHPPEAPDLAFLRDAGFDGINHKALRTVYPPLAQWAFRTAAALSPTLTAQRLQFMGFDAALLFLLAAYLRRKGRPPEFALVYAWNPLVLTEFSSSGHLDAMSLFFLVAGLFALESGRPAAGGEPGRPLPSDMPGPRLAPTAAGVALGLSFLAKLGSLILIPWMLFKRRTALAAFGAVVAAATWYFFRPSAGFAPAFLSGGDAYARTWYFNASLFAVAAEYLPLSPWTLRLAFGGATALLALLLAWKMPEDRVLAYAGIVWAACLLASPVVHPWYVVWLTPFLCFYPLWSGVAFTGTAALSYLVLPRYAATGVWDLPLRVLAAEYAVPLVLLVWQGTFPVLRGYTQMKGDISLRRPYARSRLRLLVQKSFLPLILTLVILAPCRLEAGAWVREKGELYEKLSLSFFSADRVFDPKGKRKLAAPEYKETALSLYAEYGLSADWTGVVSLPFKRATSEAFGRKESAAWLGDAWFFAKRRLPAGPFALSLQGGVKTPLGYDEKDVPTLGQGQIDWELRALLGKSFHPGYAGIEAGYRRRNGDYSDEIPYRVEAGVWVAKPVLLKVALDGVDNRLNDAAGEIATFAARSPFMFDQEYTKFSPSFIVLLSDGFSLEAGYETTIDGGNTAAGQSFFLGIAWQGPLRRTR